MHSGGTVSRLKPKSLPRFLASLFLVLGFTGLGVAAATQINGNWQGNFQAGVTMTESSCQPSDEPITGSFAPPTFTGEGETPWKISQVQFTGISPNCVGANYEVAHRNGGDWQILASPNATGTVAGDVVTVELGEFDSASGGEFAISIFD